MQSSVRNCGTASIAGIVRARRIALPQERHLLGLPLSLSRAAEAGAATYLRYAEDYDALAEQEERLARDAAELEISNQQS